MYNRTNQMVLTSLVIIIGGISWVLSFELAIFSMLVFITAIVSSNYNEIE